MGSKLGQVRETRVRAPKAQKKEKKKIKQSARKSQTPPPTKQSSPRISITPPHPTFTTHNAGVLDRRPAALGDVLLLSYSPSTLPSGGAGSSSGARRAAHGAMSSVLPLPRRARSRSIQSVQRRARNQSSRARCCNVYIRVSSRVWCACG